LLSQADSLIIDVAAATATGRITEMTRTSLFTAYLGRDAYRDRVFVEVNLETLTPRAGMQTTAHEPVTEPVIRLSISGWTLRYRSRTNRWSSGGQIVNSLVGMEEFAPGWTEDDVTSLRRIWRQYHLNDMQAACDHMDKRKARKAFDSVPAFVWDEKTRTTSRPKDSDIPADMVCPETGYRYGSAWLFKAIPAEVMTELRRLSELPAGEIVRGEG
jgi:hypothetical protein